MADALEIRSFGPMFGAPRRKLRQVFEARRLGIERSASAQDVNHNGFVCAKFEGNEGNERSRRFAVTFTDNPLTTCGCANMNRDVLPES